MPKDKVDYNEKYLYPEKHHYNLLCPKCLKPTVYYSKGHIQPYCKNCRYSCPALNYKEND
jgi:ribosomal protein S27E